MLKRSSFCMLLLVAAVSSAFSVQEPAKPKAPAIPSQINEVERDALTQSALLLSRSEFDKALAQLKPLLLPATAQVYIDWAPVPRAIRAAYLGAAQDAMRAWNLGLGGLVKFRLTDREDAADLRILFERGVAQVRTGQALLVCSEGMLDRPPTGGSQPASRRAAQVRIALNLPYTEELHSAASITHLMGQALGTYLGLSPAENPTGFMGPDTHGATVACKPSEIELQQAREIQQARLALMACAQKRTTLYLPKAVLTVEKPELDAGDVQRGEDARFLFKVTNTGDAPLEIEAKPNCGCTVANYDKVIAPGAEGKIEAEIHTTNFRGRIIKLITVKSNDLDKPQLSLRLAANVLSAVQVVPADTLILPLSDNGPTVKDLEIRTTGKDPVEISRATCSVPYAAAQLGPMGSENGAGRAYKLTLTVQPDAPIGRSVFLVTAFTTSPREPQVNITAICDKGILAVPPSVYLGAIDSSTALPVTQIITLMKNEGTFHLRKVESDDPRLQIQQETVKDGAQYRLTVTYKGGWPAGAIRSKITVETDDSRQPTIEIPVTANVVPVGTAR